MARSIQTACSSVEISLGFLCRCPWRAIGMGHNRSNPSLGREMRMRLSAAMSRVMAAAHFAPHWRGFRIMSVGLSMVGPVSMPQVPDTQTSAESDRSQRLRPWPIRLRRMRMRFDRPNARMQQPEGAFLERRQTLVRRPPFAPDRRMTWGSDPPPFAHAPASCATAAVSTRAPTAHCSELVHSSG